MGTDVFREIISPERSYFEALQGEYELLCKAYKTQQQDTSRPKLRIANNYQQIKDWLNIGENYQYGNPNDYDNYFFTGITLTYTFYDIPYASNPYR